MGSTSTKECKEEDPLNYNMKNFFLIHEKPNENTQN